MGEDILEHIWRERLVDGCSIVVYGAKGANVGFVLRDRVARCSTVPLVKEAVVVPMLRDPRQAPLLDFAGGKLFERYHIFLGEKVWT